MKIPSIIIYGLCLVLILCIGINESLAERLSVNIPQTVVRSGPGTKYKVLWKVEKYYPVQVIRKSENWFYVKDFEGDEGWILGSELKDIPSVIVIKDKCNIRSGPGVELDIVLTADKGVPFNEIERKGNWIHVKHVSGAEGWVHDSLIW